MPLLFICNMFRCLGANAVLGLVGVGLFAMTRRVKNGVHVVARAVQRVDEPLVASAVSPDTQERGVSGVGAWESVLLLRFALILWVRWHLMHCHPFGMFLL